MLRATASAAHPVAAAESQCRVRMESRSGNTDGIQRRGSERTKSRVWILGAQQILNVTAMRQAGGAQEPGLKQIMQGHTGGTCVAAEIWVACPSAVAPLLSEQRICL